VSDAAVSVVVASHARPLRLLWLLNALEEQTLGGFEVVVVHDYDGATAARVLDAHPLAEAGRLRHRAIAPGTGSPARQRNLGWRDARGALIAFTDDDCRPDAGWLDALVAATDGRVDAFVQGATRPDPFEADVFAAPHLRTLRSEPPNRFAQTANVLYPRTLLERLGGFDEALVTGEDMDLAIRARAAGAEHVGEPAAVVFHAIEALTLAGTFAAGWWWRDLVLLVRRHPELRDELTLGLFWEPKHLWVVLAAAGALAAGRRPAAALLAAPWIVSEATRRGTRPADLAVNALELPGRAAAHLGRVAAFAAGSLRYRTPVL
jgi:glycosyltransferase involved in cell wall biosynthesis